MTTAIGLLAWVAWGCSRTGLEVDDEPELPPVVQPIACTSKPLALHLAEQPPNLYFVLDRSGSMSEGMPGGGSSKWDAVQAAAVNLVRSLGAHVRVGATVFPADSGVCDPGQEVFPSLRGDPIIPGGVDGPVTRAFAQAIAVPTSGYTPTATTLAGLKTTLSSLPGKTSVVLATDGGPNCNTIGCPPSQCISNIQQVPGCNSTDNCCDASNGADAVRMCLDSDATIESVRGLHDGGIPTYVIGIPGSQPFTDLLGQLAVAGGTARASGDAYYAVNDVDQLGAALAAIGGDVVNCEFTVEPAPTDPASVVLTLDGLPIDRDTADGWSFEGAAQIRLRGLTCNAYRSGAHKVEAIQGCLPDAGLQLGPDGGLSKKP